MNNPKCPICLSPFLNKNRVCCSETCRRKYLALLNRSEKSRKRVSSALKGKLPAGWILTQTIESRKKHGETRKKLIKEGKIKTPFSFGHELSKKEKNRNWKGGISAIEKNCLICGEKFIGKHFLKTCGKKKCIQIIQSCSRRKINPKDFVCLSTRKRKGCDFNEWRMMTLGRDLFTCRICGARGIKLEVHHIKTWADNASLRYSVSNGITLCCKCHLSVRGKEKENEKYFTELII